MKSAVDNAADKEQVQRAVRADKRNRQRRIEDTKTVLSTREGRRYLWELMSACRVFATCYSSDAPEMAFKEGMRNVGLMVLSDLNECGSEWYSLMLKENCNVDD